MQTMRNSPDENYNIYFFYNGSNRGVVQYNILTSVSNINKRDSRE
jgi:hypothetical protein